MGDTRINYYQCNQSKKEWLRVFNCSYLCFCLVVSFCPQNDLLKTFKKICIFIESHHRLIGKFSAYHGEFYFLRHWKIVPGLQCVELCETFISANNDAISKCKFHLMDPTFFQIRLFPPPFIEPQFFKPTIYTAV